MFDGGPPIVRQMTNSNLENDEISITIIFGELTHIFILPKLDPFSLLIEKVKELFHIKKPSFYSESQTVVDQGTIIQTIEKNNELLVVENESFDSKILNKGLINFGNSCYLNSAIQCLFSITSFVDLLIDFIPDPNQKLLSFLSQFYIEASMNSKKNLTLFHFKALLDKVLPAFVGKEQHDCHEFLVFFLDSINFSNSLDKMFFYSTETTITCDLCCAHQTLSEKNSILSLQLFPSKILYFSPFDLQKPVKVVSSPPSCFHIYAKKMPDSIEIVESWVASCHQTIAFEAPDLSIDCVYVLCRFFSSSKRQVMLPFLMSIPSEVSLNESDLKDIVWKRISVVFKNDEALQGIYFKGSRFFFQRDFSVCSQTNLVIFIQDQWVQFIDSVRFKVEEFIPSISQILQSSFSPYQMDKTNQWKCPSCNVETQPIRDAIFSSLPSTVIIHLARFSFVEGVIKKDESNVQIDDKISINGTSFSLNAIIHHDGSPNFGHYNADCKRNGQWFNFNDTFVSRKMKLEATSSSAYILFYTH